MVGHRRGGLANIAEVRREFVYIACAVEKGVIRVKVKMGKLCCHASILGFEAEDRG